MPENTVFIGFLCTCGYIDRQLDCANPEEDLDADAIVSVAWRNGSGPRHAGVRHPRHKACEYRLRVRIWRRLRVRPRHGRSTVAVHGLEHASRAAVRADDGLPGLRPRLDR